LYGQAFRAASAFERYSYSPRSVYGNPLLTPEKITTYEAQVSYATKRIDVSVTLFRNEDNNKISRMNVKDTLRFEGSKVPFAQKYVNAGYINTNGIEVEGKTKINDYVSLLGSVTYQTSKNDAGQENYDCTPMLMAKIGVLFNYQKKASLGVYNSYFGEPGDYYLLSPKGDILTKMANPSAKAYNNLSANASFNITNTFKLKIPQISLTCYASNLLDEKIYYPEVVRRNINTLPGRPGREIMGGILLSF
jgi:outer membrane receptor for ferrienterochelin and colicin